MNIVIKGINPGLRDMMRDGLFSPKKIAALIRLKKFVDQIATCNYLTEEEVASLGKKYGTVPDILTWGDYFQTEIGSMHFAASDEEFVTIVDTIRFDLISSYKIFHNKPEEFFTMIEAEALCARGAENEWSEEEAEMVHLSILKDYYLNLGLKKALIPDVDLKWYEDFSMGRSAAI